MVSVDGIFVDAVFGEVEHNQMHCWPDAAGLNMPYGVAATSDLPLVADTANARRLAWALPAMDTGADAHALTGDADVNSKGDNRWTMPARDSLRWPYAISVSGEHAVVADSGNNRVVLWRLAAELLS